MKKRKIQIPIFNVPIILIRSSIDTVLAYLQAIYHENFAAMRLDWELDGCCFASLPDGKIVIWLAEENVKWPILSHETGHATFEIMRMIGIQLTDEEVFCYLQQYINEQCQCMLLEPMEPIDPPQILEDTLQ